MPAAGCPHARGLVSYNSFSNAVSVRICGILQIAGDRLTQLADANWSAKARARPQPPKFNPELVEDIYANELHGAKSTPPQLRRVMLLEVCDTPTVILQAICIRCDRCNCEIL